jgi:FtsZ-binding cell division protein ZapB
VETLLIENRPNVPPATTDLPPAVRAILDRADARVADLERELADLHRRFGELAEQREALADEQVRVQVEHDAALDAAANEVLGRPTTGVRAVLKRLLGRADVSTAQGQRAALERALLHLDTELSGTRERLRALPPELTLARKVAAFVHGTALRWELTRKAAGLTALASRIFELNAIAETHPLDNDTPKGPAPLVPRNAADVWGAVARDIAHLEGGSIGFRNRVRAIGTYMALGFPVDDYLDELDPADGDPRRYADAVRAHLPGYVFGAH